jgi:hypothetical protein
VRVNSLAYSDGVLGPIDGTVRGDRFRARGIMARAIAGFTMTRLLLLMPGWEHRHAVGSHRHSTSVRGPGLASRGNRARLSLNRLKSPGLLSTKTGGRSQRTEWSHPLIPACCTQPRKQLFATP